MHAAKNPGSIVCRLAGSFGSPQRQKPFTGGRKGCRATDQQCPPQLFDHFLDVVQERPPGARVAYSNDSLANGVSFKVLATIGVT